MVKSVVLIYFIYGRQDKDFLQAIGYELISPFKNIKKYVSYRIGNAYEGRND